MDLLCTENIEGDTLCQQQQQQQQQQQEKHNKLESLEIKTTNSLSPAVYSSNISLASTSQASSGYHSSSSGSSSDSSDSINVAKCEHHFKKQSTSKEIASEKNTSAAVKTSYVDTKNYNNNNNNNKHFIINRPMDYVNTAAEDPTFLTDRCLENALKAEEKRPQPVCTYFKTVQDEITPPMRKIVAEWMMEVCAEEKCQEEVVLVALNYMDRFLSIKSVRKTHLQILAAACLLLASKLREPSCRALSAELLVFYTDNSIHKTDLIKWELFVLSSLHWDLSCVTPLDFLELLLIRLPIRTRNCPDLDVDKVREHAQAFISLAAKEHHFSLYTASTIAASSIAAALSGLNWHLRAGQNLRHLFNLLTDLTSVEQDYLYDCMTKMEKTFEEHSRNLQTYLPSTDRQSPTIPSNISSTTSCSSSSSSSSTTAATMCYISQQYPHQQQQSRQTMNLGVPFIPITHSPSSTYSHSHYCQYKQQQQQQQQQQYQPHLYHCQHPPQYHHKSSTCVANNGKVSGNSNSSNAVLLPDLTQTCKMQANAQKDVQDIKF